MRRLRAVMLDELLLAVAVPGFLLCAGWAVMYEIYHEDGSYYTTLMQEILGGDGLFSYFLVSAILMAFPVGFIIDTVREVVGERWFGIPRARMERAARPSPLQQILRAPLLGNRFEERYAAYRHARSAVLAPAKAAGNLALVLLIFLVWFVIKIFRMQGWHVFSLAFIIGTPVVGLGIFGALCTRYVAGLAEFQAFMNGVIAPAPVSSVPHAPEEDSLPSSAVRIEERLQSDAR
jgi:hypothetical protein